MKCHQKLIKEKTEPEDRLLYPNLFDRPISDYVLQKENLSPEIRDFVNKYEWMGTMGVSPRWVFTARIDGVLGCVVCLNLPNAFSKLLGDRTREWETLIQRGASTSFCHKHMGSKLIRWACKWMVNNTEKRLFTGYADPLANERGILYRACGFEFLGKNFGTKLMCVHPTFKEGKPFSPQSLRRTALWKKWYKEWHGVPLPKEWLRPNGFKDMAIVEKLAPEAKKEFYDYGDKIIAESKKIRIPSKGKYVLVLGKDKREQRVLNSLKTYKTKPYPKD